nr:hypothetical protein CFP56_27941 [Quercus suber]
MGSDKIQSMILWSPKSEPEEEPVLKQQNFVEVVNCHSLDLQSFFQLLPEIMGLPPNLPPCLGVTSHMFPHSSTMPPIWPNRYWEYSFEELFRDLQLTGRNHVEILCETFPPPIGEHIAPIVKRIGVHVECNCPPPPQNPSILQSGIRCRFGDSFPNVCKWYDAVSSQLAASDGVSDAPPG